MQRFIALLLLLIILFGGLSYLYWHNSTRSTGPQIGDSIPVDSLLQDIHAKELSFQFLLIKFWGSWCSPCRREHPQWISLYEAFQDVEQSRKVLAVIGVALESDSVSWKVALKRDQLPWDGHILQDRDLKAGWAGRIHIQGVPENLLIDSSGLVLGRNMDPDETERFLRHRLTK